MERRNFVESRREMEEILQDEVLGYLGVSDRGKPYVIPLNYSYVNGRIIFHCALEGKKLDCIWANPNVCFTVGRQSAEVRPHGEGEMCHVDSDSVTCYGTARILDEPEEGRQELDVFNRSIRPDAEEITPERAEMCGAVEIRISEMTGRREHEKKRTYWRHGSGS